MVATVVLCAFLGLLRPADSRSLPSWALAGDGIPVPKFKADFKKGDTPAQWAKGYPKKWGSEDSRFQYSVPNPEDRFNAIVTEDEKYLAMFNGSHATFVDLESKATVSTFGLSSEFVEIGQTIRVTPQGGYDLYTDGGSKVFQRRLTSDFKPTGQLISYLGAIADFQGKNLVTSTGTTFNIYDVSNPNSTTIELKIPSQEKQASLSSDGQYLSITSLFGDSADLWNATTGDRILQFPVGGSWLTKISPDGKYVALSHDGVDVYSLADLAAPPQKLGGFNYRVKQMEWSPDGKYLATGDNGRMRLWQFPEGQLMQTWEADFPQEYTMQISGLTWLDGGNKISWIYRYGRYMYDFESNFKYWWTPGYEDQLWGPGGVYFLKKMGSVATLDGDSRVRVWKI